jgi:hypothetical protein
MAGMSTITVEVLLNLKISVAHMSPLPGSGLMPCCGKTLFEVPATDIVQDDFARVTCGLIKGGNE